MSLICHFL